MERLGHASLPVPSMRRDWDHLEQRFGNLYRLASRSSDGAAMTMTDSTAEQLLRDADDTQPPEDPEHLAWSKPLIVPDPRTRQYVPWREDEP